MNIGKTIAALRRKKVMTQEELAEKIGVTPQTVSKWETGVTMPDIMLLPVIADIFGITIDELYGRKSFSEFLSFDDLPEEAYFSVLKCMQKAWNTAEGENHPIAERAKDTANYLSKFPDSHSMIVTKNKGFTYASSDIALSYFANEQKMYDLLTDKSAGAFLKVLSDDAFRFILFHCMNNQNSFTANYIAQKFNLSETDVQRAIDKLVNINLIHCSEIEIDDSKLKVYSGWSTHKVCIICAILRLAGILSEYKEHYRGFRS